MDKESDLKLNAPVVFCDEGWALVREYDREGWTLEGATDAIFCFEKAIKSAPYMIDAIRGRASCLVKRCQIKLSENNLNEAAKDLESAVNDLKKLLEKNPEDPYAHLNQGLCLYLQGVLNGKNPKESITDDVIKEMENAISCYKIRGEFHFAHFNLAQLYVLSGDYSKAKEHLEKAVNSDSVSLNSKATKLLEGIKIWQ